MPSDIRSFFGGKPAQPASQQSPSKNASNAKTSKKVNGRSRKVVDESDDEDEPLKKSAVKPSPTKKRERSPEGEVTTTADYFGKAKSKKSAPVETAASKKKTPTATPKSTPKKGSAQTPQSTRTSSRRKPSVNYDESQKTNGLIDDEEDGKDDIFAAEFSKSGRVHGDDYEEDEGESDIEVKPLARSRGKGKQSKISKDEDDDFKPNEDVEMKDTQPDGHFPEPDDDEEIKIDRPATKSKATNGVAKKRKSHELEQDSDEEEVLSKKTKSTKKQTPKQSPVKKKGQASKKDDVPENSEIQAIFDNIPSVPLPSSLDENGQPQKPKGFANQAAPPAKGSKEVPIGNPNCLAGLSFVFTGLLESLQREDGQNLVKRYGGKVTGAPSSKTSYVVLGSDAGPSKIKTIQKNNLKTIDEDGLFELIRRMPANGGDSKAGAEYEKKQQAELQKIEKMAAEAEKEETKTGGTGGGGVAGTKNKPPADPHAIDTRLWTVKHAPTMITQICGNNGQVERLQTWLRKFPKNLKTNFKLAGADGSGTYRAVILSGPPGIGKTTAAHLVANLEGYDVVESNASDTRSKKLVEQGLRGVIDTTSLLGYFSGDGKAVDPSKRKLCFIMDEVDGMSAGDRGGVGALAAVCKKTEVPMILICNDRKLPKMRPFDHVAYNLPFKRPTTQQIKSRVMSIAFREGLKTALPTNVVEALIEGTGADIRQVINMLSTIKTDQTQEDAAPVDFDRGKQMSKAWEKHIILRPWDIVAKILAGGLFAPSSKTTLNEKSELYFNDHEFSSLMLQENYLGTNPAALGSLHGRERTLKNLELVEKAANSISEGDLVDRMIHGSEQQWSLMPLHAIFSFVRPASFVAGSLAGHQTNFTQWLGKNSSQGKLTRMVKEIQGHMRLHSSGDRNETRQQYIPMLWSKLVKTLEIEGKDAVPGVIELMDSYFLTKDDWDAISELGVGNMSQENLKIDTQTKSTFTRMYNAESHPMPFMKASNVIAPKKQAKEKPDLEEALEESSEEDVVEDEAKVEDDEEDELDLSKDKYVKQPKKGGKKAGAGTSGKGKGKKGGQTAGNGEDIEMDDEDDVKPKGKGKAKGKAKGKK